jgi:hypothetical protein
MNTVTLIDLDDASASSGNSLLSVVAQLSLSLGVACAGALLGGFTAAGSAEGVETTLGAFQLTFVTIGIMACWRRRSSCNWRRRTEGVPVVRNNTWSRRANGHEAGRLCATFSLRTAGPPVTTESTAFATLPLSAAMLANLDALGYASMTPIQAQSLPVILKART